MWGEAANHLARKCRCKSSRVNNLAGLQSMAARQQDGGAAEVESVESVHVKCLNVLHPGTRNPRVVLAAQRRRAQAHAARQRASPPLTRRPLGEEAALRVF